HTPLPRSLLAGMHLALSVARRSARSSWIPETACIPISPSPKPRARHTAGRVRLDGVGRSSESNFFSKHAGQISPQPRGGISQTVSSEDDSRLHFHALHR